MRAVSVICISRNWATLPSQPPCLRQSQTSRFEICRRGACRGISMSFRAKSRNLLLFLSMSRDYDFWVYIMTNQHDSVLYIGITNDLSRRLGEHQSGEIPGFTTDYRCHKLVYHE